MAAFGLESFGASVMLARLERLRDDIPKEAARALYREAHAIFRASQRIVPVDKGFLRASGVLEGPTNGEVLIGYGGPAASYAIYVHEDPEARHKPGKSYKYLEKPLYAAIPGMEQRIADQLKRRAEEQEAAKPPEGESPETGTETKQ